MMGKTHIAWGQAFSVGGLILLNVQNPILGVVGIAFGSAGSLMPDIDHPMATISKKNLIFGGISRLVSAPEWGKHRRFWHTPIACVLMAVVLWMLLVCFTGLFSFIGNLCANMLDSNIVNQGLQLVGKYIPTAVLFFFIGEISHIFADTFNPEGSPWLFPIMPLKRKIHVPVICVTTGTIFEQIYKGIAILGTVVLLYYYVTQVLGYFPDALPSLIRSMR